MVNHPPITHFSEQESKFHCKRFLFIERDKKSGIIKPEIDADVMIDMFYNFVLLSFYKTGHDEEKFMATLDEAIKIMREGVSVK